MVEVNVVVPSGLSARLSICPPLVRSAPGLSSFLSCVVPLLLRILRLVAVALVLARFFFSGVFSLARPLFADAAVVRPGSSAFVGPSVSSRGGLRPVGPCRLPFRSVASVCC